MSVLIKNMEMPTNCAGCPLNYDQMACGVTGTRWWSDSMVLMNFDSDKERLPNCPLIEIPTPHGRLIDADAIDYKNHKMHDGTGHLVVADNFVNGVLWVNDCIDETPTIIESEKE